MMIINAFDTHCKGACFTEVFHWLVRMKIARYEVCYFNCTWVADEAQDFMIKLKVLSAMLVPYFSLAKRTLLHRHLIVL